MMFNLSKHRKGNWISCEANGSPEHPNLTVHTHTHTHETRLFPVTKTDLKTTNRAGDTAQRFINLKPWFDLTLSPAKMSYLSI